MKKARTPMITNLSAGWLATLVFCCGCLGGAIYTFDVFRDRSVEQKYSTCLDKASLYKDGRHWRDDVSKCERIYTASKGGKYGPRSTATISLAMTRRPNFKFR